MPNFDEIPLTEPWLGKRERRMVNRCLKEGWVSSAGEFVGQFEAGFARYCGAKYGVATSNGTAALHLALAVLNIGPGDEVIVPTLSFVASANVVTYTGAKVVFVDSALTTWGLCAAGVQKAITPRTRAIIPVHLYGRPVEMDKILTLSRKHDIPVVEDACEAHGAEFRGRRVGSLGTIGCFSFYGNKIITTGEGGMLVTNNRDIAESARMLRDHGMSRKKKYWHPRIGFNYRMTNMQAALGVAQLERIDRVIQVKRRIAKLYRALLKDVPGVAVAAEVPWASSVHWLFTVLIKSDGLESRRDTTLEELRRNGIDARPVFGLISRMPPYKQSRKRRFPVAERISKEGLSLPSSPLLKPQQIRRICTIIKDVLGSSSRRSRRRNAAYPRPNLIPLPDREADLEVGSNDHAAFPPGGSAAV